MSEIGPQELLQHMQVPGPNPGALAEKIYVVGSFERRVTLYSQQVRALNLAYALFELKELTAGSRVAVIGGGVAGVTAAAALAHLGASVELIERGDVLLPLQKACRTRWVHPRIYDWPGPDSELDEASVPLLPWDAGYAHDVAVQLEDGFNAVVQRTDRIQATVAATVNFLKGGPRPSLGWRGVSPSGRKVTRTGESFDAVVLAVGFGLESGTEDLPMSSYWRNDDLDQPVLRPPGTRVRCLVSGTGDGGIIDVLRLRVRDFKLEALHSNLRELFGAPELEELSRNLLKWEDESHHQLDPWLWNTYDQGVKLAAKSEDALLELLRTDTDVWLASSESPISFRSAILNRLWVALLVKYDPHLNWIPSATKRITKHAAGASMTFVDSTSRDQEFDRVVIRHGPTPALCDALKWVDDLCRPVLKPLAALDQTRKPIWKPDTYLIKPSAPPVAPSRLEPAIHKDIVQQQAVDRNGSTTNDVISGRAITKGGAIVAPVYRGGPGGSAQSGPSEICFESSCRVSMDSIRDVVRSSRLPKLRWHPSIQYPLKLAIKQGQRADQRATEPELISSDGPAHQQLFFTNLQRILVVNKECESALERLCRAIESEPSAQLKAQALHIFAGFAALRMIARLRSLEGKLLLPDGRPIVNLFPALPAVTSSWLVRRVPYRSELGASAFGETEFLLARVGVSEHEYSYFLLPRREAEQIQDADVAIPHAQVMRWIAPQWHFEVSYGTIKLARRLKILMLTDERGRERAIGRTPLPWQDDVPLDEDPHSMPSSRVETWFPEPGWEVHVLRRS